MKILALRLRNLNSLAGSWAVDFTVPEYAASGIFAITGPTGAGKSTLLDAICLALFARTPRLGHISKGSNEIMSRRAGDCFAEVEFATRQGAFRCHWAQHRARRSPGGELQAPRHEMVDAESGKVVESRSKEVVRLVEQVTGMDYDRFTRSILLAQGDFAVFLDADADQRAPILEQITGTGIYSRISMAVHERTSEERQKTALLQEAMGRIVLLEEEEERALTVGIRDAEVTAAGLQQRLAALSRSLHRLDAIAALTAQIVETDRLLIAAAQRREAAQDDLTRLECGRRAQSLLAEYTQWRQSGERIAVLQAREGVLRTELEYLHRERQRLGEAHAQALQALQEARDVQQRESGTIAKVRALDLRLHEKKQTVAQREGALRHGRLEREQVAGQRREQAEQQEAIARHQEESAAFFREHGSDGLLAEQFSGIREQLHQLGQRESEVERLTQALQEKQAGLGEAQQHRTQARREHELAAQERLTLQQRQQTLLADRSALLAGQEPAFWRQRVEEAVQRWRQLEQAVELLGRKKAMEAELTVLTGTLRQQRTQEQRLQEEMRQWEAQRSLAEQLVAQCERNRHLNQRIRSLDEERRRLEDGAPCPLCGAIHHPWAEEVPEVETADATLAQARNDLDRIREAIVAGREGMAGLVKDIEHTGQAIAVGERQLVEWTTQLAQLLTLFGGETELPRLLAADEGQVEAARRRVEAIERLEGELDRVRTQVEQASVRCAHLQQREQAAGHGVALIEAEMQRLAAQIRDAQVWIEACRTGLAGQLQPLGMGGMGGGEVCPPGGATALLHHLEARLRVWKEQQARSEALHRQHSAVQAELDKLDLLLATLDTTLSRQEAELATLQRELDLLLVERQECYGDRDPDVEEQRHRVLVEQTEAREQTLRTQSIALEKQAHALSEQQRLGAAELAVLVPQCQAQEAQLLARLPGAGFADLDAFRAALLPAETLAVLEQRKRALDTEQTALAARRAEQTAALAREEEQTQQGPGREDLVAEQTEKNRELAAVQQQIGADRERLAAHNRQKAEFAAQQQALAAQRRELERWELLHLLIGSADGKKFRVFAQNLTFEVMISHANRQLRRMNDRYILLVDAREPLALQVIDNYQAGEIRSTRNLSGGESFLVSLALALGLSAMASHNVRVDSLFLDEGFGTLDEESLDVALQTLAELRQDGKLIGIISHVPMLRDRIDVRIQVQPGPGGNSRLLGPGCVQLA